MLVRVECVLPPIYILIAENASLSDLSPSHPLSVCHHLWSTIYIIIPSLFLMDLKYGSSMFNCVILATFKRKLAGPPPYWILGWVCCFSLRGISVGLVLLPSFGFDSWIFHGVRLVQMNRLEMKKERMVNCAAKLDLNSTESLWSKVCLPKIYFFSQ